MYASMNSLFFSMTIRPAAAFKHTDLEKSLSSPLKISIILFELNSASSPKRLSNFSAFIFNSLGSIVSFEILLSFN